MPRASDDPTLSVPAIQANFRTANPEVFGKAGDLETTRRLGVVESRAEALKQRFYAHFERNEDVWVSREALKLVAQRTFPTFQHPAPRGFEPRKTGQDFAELMMTKARQNVHARAILRLSAINTIKTSMQNAVIRNTPKRAQVQERRPANDHPKTRQRQGSP